MKNLKKLSRNELKSVFGGSDNSEAGDNLWKCCNTKNQCSGCAGYGVCAEGFSLVSHPLNTH